METSHYHPRLIQTQHLQSPYYVNSGYNDTTFYEETPTELVKVKNNSLYFPSPIKTEDDGVELKQEFPMLSQLGELVTYQQAPQEDVVDQHLMGQMEEQIFQKICSCLNVPEDVSRWSTMHVREWILYYLSQHHLDLTLVDNFHPLDGNALLRMSKSDFSMRSQQAGSILYDELCWFKSGGRSSLSYLDLDAYNKHHTTSQPSPMLSAQPQEPSSLITIIPKSVTDSLYGYDLSSPITDQSLSPSHSGDSMEASDLSQGWTSYAENDMSRCRLQQHPHQKPGLVPGKHNVQLWQFLKDLLRQPQLYGSCIRWLDQAKGIFKIEDSSQVARLWGQRKNRPAMNYDKLSRSIRQYYKKGIIKKTDNSKRLVYQFCVNFRQ